MNEENSLSGLSFALQPYSQQQQDNNPHQKEFQCPICMKYFSRKFTLDMHFLIHQGVKPHACPFCGKCFRQKGTLMRHKALHSNKALFHCSLCNRGFRQKNVFLHHLKHRHKVSTENLDRRKCRTQLSDSQSLINNLPPFALADTTAISSSDKHLEAMLLRSLEAPLASQSDQNQNTIPHVREIGAIHSQDSNDSNSRGYTGVLVHESMEEKIIPDSSSTGTGVTQQMWNGTGDHLITQSVTVQKNSLTFKCDFCSKLFTSENEYSEHTMEEHGNVEMIDRKPLILSAQNTNIFSSENSRSRCGSVSTSSYSTSHQPSALVQCDKTKSQQLVSNSQRMGASSTSEITFSCIPCQLDFNSEDDFECHVKTHVQSVLLSDSESVEMDQCQETQLPTSVQKNKICERKESTSTNLRADVPDRLIQPATSTSAGSEVRNSNFRHPASVEYPGFQVGGRKYSNTPNSLVAASPVIQSPITKFGVAHSAIEINDNHKTVMINIGGKLVEGSSNQAYSDSGHLGGETTPLISSDGMERVHVLQVYMCPFCKKHCTSSFALRKHTRIHINSIFSKRKLDVKLNTSNKKECKRNSFSHKKILCIVNKKWKKAKHVLSNSLPPERENFTKKGKNLHSRSQCYKSNQIGERKITNHLSSKCTKDTSLVCSIKDKLNEVSCNSQKHACKEIKLHPSITCMATYDQSGKITHQLSQKKCCRVSPDLNSSMIEAQSKQKFRCIKCSKTFKQEILYCYHQQMHLGVRNFGCHLCKRRFTQKELLLKHTRSNHMKCYKCSVCMKTFQYRIIYEHHIKSCSKHQTVDSIVSKDENMCVPLVDLQRYTELKSQGVIGFIPVKGGSGTNPSGTDTFSSLVGIPVLSFTQFQNLSSECLPVVGNIELSAKHCLVK